MTMHSDKGPLLYETWDDALRDRCRRTTGNILIIPRHLRAPESERKKFTFCSSGDVDVRMPGVSPRLTAGGFKFASTESEPVLADSTRRYGNSINPSGFTISAPTSTGAASALEDATRIKCTDSTASVSTEETPQVVLGIESAKSYEGVGVGPVAPIPVVGYLAKLRQVREQLCRCVKGTTVLAFPTKLLWTTSVDGQMTLTDPETRRVIEIREGIEKFRTMDYVQFLIAGDSNICDLVMSYLRQRVREEGAGVDLSTLVPGRVEFTRVVKKLLKKYFTPKYKNRLAYHAEIFAIDRRCLAYGCKYVIDKKKGDAARSGNVYVKTINFVNVLKTSEDVTLGKILFANMCSEDDAERSRIKASATMLQCSLEDYNTGGCATIHQGGPDEPWDCVARPKLHTEKLGVEPVWI